MTAFAAGYRDLLREALWLPNGGAYLSFPARLPWLILVCGLIGLARNALHVALGTPIFYSFAPDILWTMFFWPISLFLFPGALLHGLLRLLSYRDIRAEATFALTFHLQVLHLLIPFVDAVGFSWGLPWMIELGVRPVTTDWFSNFLVMTPGIVFAWLTTAYFVARALRHRLQVGWPALVEVALAIFVIILVPIYFVWPTFNTLFNRAFGLLVWNPDDPRLLVPRQIQWGYGSYMVATATAGYIYLQRLGLEGSAGS